MTSMCNIDLHKSRSFHLQQLLFIFFNCDPHCGKNDLAKDTSLAWLGIISASLAEYSETVKTKPCKESFFLYNLNLWMTSQSCNHKSSSFLVPALKMGPLYFCY